MRVNMAAAAGAAIAALLPSVGHAKQPAQVVVTLAASCAFLALLTQRRQATPSDWFTVRLLLVVFGASNEHQLGIALAVTAILSGLALLLVAIWARVLQQRKRRPER
jgi:hypothetical protein